MRKRDENKLATISDVRSIVNEEVTKIVSNAISDTVRQIIEYIGIVHDKLDSKIDQVDKKLSSGIDGLSQEAYETKVELKNEIRGLRNDHNIRITKLEASSTN